MLSDHARSLVQDRRTGLEPAGSEVFSAQYAKQGALGWALTAEIVAEAIDMA